MMAGVVVVVVVAVALHWMQRSVSVNRNDNMHVHVTLYVSLHWQMQNRVKKVDNNDYNCEYGVFCVCNYHGQRWDRVTIVEESVFVVVVCCEQNRMIVIGGVSHLDRCCGTVEKQEILGEYCHCCCCC